MKEEKTDKKTITLAHGNGGRFSHDLVRRIFLPRFENRHLAQLLDGAVLPADKRRLVLTTDTYVVRPCFFPGGDIGRLAVSGTVNDLAVCGAEPKYLSAGFVIEEGFPEKSLKKIAVSMKEAADEAGVIVVTGDTKVVERGNADGVYVNTSGIGFLPEKIDFSPLAITAEDRVIVSGTVGDHAVAVMKARGDYPIEMNLESDVAPLWPLIRLILTHVDPGMIRVMRDPTRGGIATTLNEFVRDAKRSIEIDEECVPIADQVRAVCELTGFDPLYLANEGKIVLVCDPRAEGEILEIMNSHPLGKNARAIGTVTDDPLCKVYGETSAGGTRIIDMLAHDMLPRIC